MNIEIANLNKNVNNIGQYAFANSSIKEIYFYGEKPEFGKNALLDLNVTIYYPANSTTWNISNFDPVGAKDIIFVPWNPIEEGPEETEESEGTQKREGTGKNDKGFFEEHKTLLFIIIAIVVILIICIIIVVFIKKRRAKTSDGIESIKGELISENMN